MKRLMAVHPRGVWYPDTGPASTIRHPREIFDVEDADVKKLVAGELAVSVRTVVATKDTADDRGDTIHKGQVLELREDLADKLVKAGAAREADEDDALTEDVGNLLNERTAARVKQATTAKVRA